MNHLNYRSFSLKSMILFTIFLGPVLCKTNIEIASHLILRFCYFFSSLQKFAFWMFLKKVAQALKLWKYKCNSNGRHLFLFNRFKKRSDLKDFIKPWQCPVPDQWKFSFLRTLCYNQNEFDLSSHIIKPLSSTVRLHNLRLKNINELQKYLPISLSLHNVKILGAHIWRTK